MPSIVLQAVENHVDRLERLVELEKGTASNKGRLFPDPAKTERGSGETRVPVTMRLTAANLGVLDHLVITTGAKDRSQLITAALRADFS